MAKVFMHDQREEYVGIRTSNANLTVNCPAASTVKIESEEVVRTMEAGETGRATFEGLAHGEWQVTITDGEQIATDHINIVTDYEMSIDFFTATIDIAYPAGSECTCICVDKNIILTAPDKSGNWTCVVPDKGEWVISITNGEQVKTKNVTVSYANQVVNVNIVYFAAVINVVYPSGAVCSCECEDTVYYAPDTNGYYSFVINRPGTWTVTAADINQTVSLDVLLETDEQVEDLTIKFFAATIDITYPSGADCTCSDGTTTFRAPDTSGRWSCVVPRTGTWIIKATNHSDVYECSVEIHSDGQETSVVCEFFRSYIDVTYPGGVFKVVLWRVDSFNTKTHIAEDTSGSGSYKFIVREAGDYEIGVYRVEPYSGIETVAGDYNSENATITEPKQTASVSIVFNAIPKFTYSGGTYKIVDDNGEPIDTTTGNWNIHFLTSGTFKATKLNGARDRVDVFVLGGGGNGGSALVELAGYGSGGGGGGGGYYTNVSRVSIVENDMYDIKIGGPGGTSEGFGVSASGGGSGGNGVNANNVDTGGGVGGEGGRSGGKGAVTDNSNGSNGEDGVYAFGGDSGTLYGPGGGGGYAYNIGTDKSSPEYSGGKDGGGDSGKDAAENTGGGGGGGCHKKDDVIVPGGKGGSGIIIIRNTRL